MNQLKSKVKFNALLIIPISLTSITVLSFFLLSSIVVSADSSTVDTVQITVNAACTLSSSLGTTTGVTGSTDAGGNNTYTTTIDPDNTKEINGSVLSTVCNDSAGYSLYAIGYSGNSYTAASHTQMIHSINSDYNISTNTSGDDSYWAMKLSAVTTPTAITPPTILNSFNDWHVIPNTYTEIAKYTSTTASTTATGSTVQTNYKVNISATQAAGSYTGKVKYTMVHPNDVPANVNMQNWTGCSSLAIGSETFLKDTRDNKFYRVAKFNDGKCWMAENLDLAGGTALSAADTDVTSDYINSFTTSNNLTKDGNTIVLPASSTTGFDTDNYSYVFNSGKTGTNCSSPGCYSYYSWDAATLGSGRNISTNNTDAPYSICPKGWHLPNTRSGTNSTSDLRQLMIILGGSADIATYNADTSPTGAEMFNALSGFNLAFLRAGFYYNSTFGRVGSYGHYWSATSFSGASSARGLGFNSTYADPTATYSRKNGFSLRCIAN